MTAIVEDLLLLARSDSGAIELERVPMDLGDVAADGASALSKPATDRGVRVEVDPQPAMIAGDPARLRQLVMILVDNAIRHSPADGRVGVQVRADGGGAALVVEDDGPGIRPEDLPHVFERFYRAAGRPGRRDRASAWPSRRGSSTATAARSRWPTGPKAGPGSWSTSRGGAGLERSCPLQRAHDALADAALLPDGRQPCACRCHRRRRVRAARARDRGRIAAPASWTRPAGAASRTVDRPCDRSARRSRRRPWHPGRRCRGTAIDRPGAQCLARPIVPVASGDQRRRGRDRDREPHAFGVAETAVLMPITAPVASRSGPPLLPGLIAASVWSRSGHRDRAAGARHRRR